MRVLTGENANDSTDIHQHGDTEEDRSGPAPLFQTEHHNGTLFIRTDQLN